MFEHCIARESPNGRQPTQGSKNNPKTQIIIRLIERITANKVNKVAKFHRDCPQNGLSYKTQNVDFTTNAFTSENKLDPGHITNGENTVDQSVLKSTKKLFCNADDCICA